MHRRRRCLGPLLSLLSLLSVGCGPADDAAPLLGRLDKTDARLAALEAKLDTAIEKLQVVSTFVTAETERQAAAVQDRAEREEERSARAAEREEARERRKALRDEIGRRPRPEPRGMDEGWASDELPKRSSRAIEGAEDAIECEEPTDREVKCTVEYDFLKKLVSEPALFAKQARIVPSQKDGVTKGFKFYGIRRGTLPKLLTVKNGDMLVAINGKSMTSLDELMDMYTKLRRARSLTLEFVRKGLPYTVELEILR
ncbi:MAG: hypothetical protein AAF721_28535 [Myxococcota bacterium]